MKSMWSLWWCACAVLLPAPLSAHRMAADCVLEGKTLRVEAYYPADGRPVMSASVTVTGGDGRVVGKGKTDTTGVFTCEVTGRGPYSAVVESPPHRAACMVVPGGGSVRPSGPARRARREGYPTVQVLAGVSVCLSLGAFLLCVAAWRRIQRLERSLSSD